MELHQTKIRIDVKGSDISGSVFDDVNLSGATLHNVNMSGWRVDYVNLAGLHVTGANLAGATIADSRYEGMTIDGIAVTALLAAHRREHARVSAEAQLFVTDIDVALDFFTARLGFAIDFVWGRPPHYAQVRRDQARINLRSVGEAVFVGDIREREHLLSASVTLESADAVRQLESDYQNAGVDFHQPSRREPWGAQTFIVRDPDRNLILFAGPAD